MRIRELDKALLFSKDDAYEAAGLRLQMALGNSRKFTQLETIALTSTMFQAREIGIEALVIYGDGYSLKRLETVFSHWSDASGKYSEEDILMAGEAILKLEGVLN